MSSALEGVDARRPSLGLDVPEGVYAPLRDTALLGEAVVARLGAHPRARVLDLCTGSGAVALSAATVGAVVTAVDIDERAVAAARVNAERCGLWVDVRHGDLFEPVRGSSFDLISCNPPYLPAPPGANCARWDAGPDGRFVINRLCREAYSHLGAGGVLLLVQSHLTGIEQTLGLLREARFDPEIIADHVGRLGPIASSRRRYLAQRLGSSPANERLVVIEAKRSR
jgi:release factor glutamine methyltransferase